MQPISRIHKFTLPASEFILRGFQILHGGSHVVSEGHVHGR